MKPFTTLLVLGTLAALGGAAFVSLGVYNIGADDPHWPLTYRVLEIVRDRSISRHAADLVAPTLDDAELIRSGAGNYHAMCVGCHLYPGAEPTELSQGLYPQPPAWSELAKVDPREAFWAIKHGIKMSGMPAWGRSMDDAYIWGLVALLPKLPTLTPSQYRELVASSGGHSHGGGERMPQAEHHATAHDDTGRAAHEHAPAAPAPSVHVHADGKTHVHDDPAAEKPETEAGHDPHHDH